MGGIDNSKKSAGVKSPASKSTVKKSTAAKTASEKNTAAPAKKTAAKKPVAGIDENGTFRAWDNAKTKAAPKKTEAVAPVKRGTTAEQAAKNLAAAKAADPSLKSEGKKLAAYDDSQIKHLDALEHIRLRSGMYIGRLGDGSNPNDGIYVLLKEVI
ncbi:MAG TPA: DNA topoisomerase IV, partial [Treponema sp.]|nr:DNA topoisomerase IV [Treponema sp.]